MLHMPAYYCRKTRAADAWTQQQLTKAASTNPLAAELKRQSLRSSNVKDEEINMGQVISEIFLRTTPHESIPSRFGGCLERGGVIRV